MESTIRGWRALARRQWPLALALALLVFIELSTYYEMVPNIWWQVPGTLLLGGVAVVAPRQPFDAALVGAATVLFSSVLLHVVDSPIPLAFAGWLTPSETGAVMAMMAYVIRQAPKGRAVAGSAALLLAIAASYLLRHKAPIDYEEGYTAPPTPLYDLLQADLLALALAVGAGLYFRGRDTERRRSLAAAVTAAQQAERMALARELHDVVAHHVTGMVVHAQAAKLVATRDPAAADRSLDLIANSGTEALSAMRRLVGTLRQAERTNGAPGAAGEATTDLGADLRRVAEQSAAVGPPVRLVLQLPEHPRPEVARSVLRVVQESLTNARKHAHGATAVTVEVTPVAGALRVSITDDGQGTRHDRGEPVGGSGGFGLVGMRERVELLDGRFSAGPGPDGGWTVHAELPLREGES
ncbi:sensor histidine kinase [Streptoalloteichus hindustanus]|uniref:sensor histidine kinase n=1 Tax=Streptoalloteichus hindustanus TaxID=2017 RepID=UPI000935CD38|nr:histidine kinase [Streptoalloteichus hindustanus]